MYARSLRYRVAGDKAAECLRLAEEMVSRYERLLGHPLRHAILVREVEGEVEVSEIYFFGSWEEWRGLMEASRGDRVLEELWGRFSRLVPEDSIAEEEWGVARLSC